jgi:hypothetical protein
MNTLLRICASLAAFSSVVPAHAHIGYGGRDLGTFGTAGGSATIANQVVSSNFGWADGLDADFGDSHRMRAFRFTLTEATTVTFSAEAFAAATATSVGGLLPGFSIYDGLAHLAPLKADHDSAAATVAYLASLPGAPKEGAFRAMDDWEITNDSGDPRSVFTYVGSAFDENFDGKASGSFSLAAGNYSVFVGGVNYVAQLYETAYPSYGLKVTLNVAPVPEPETYAMFLAGLGLVGLIAHRRKQA